MGVCVSNASTSTVYAKQETVAADSEDDIKILLLGPGESGKSTILKQMRIIQLNGLSESMRKGHRIAIQMDVIESMQQLLDAIQQLHMEMPSDDMLDKAELVMATELTQIQREGVSEEIWHSIALLWGHKTLQDCYKRKHEFELMDSAKYFLDNVERIGSKDYIPSEQDVLQKRSATLGIVEIKFNHSDLTFRIIDVGGQKSQRRKWLHQFDCVNMVIFIIAINEYDRRMLEDGSTNRMLDSIQLFSETVNSKWLRKIEITLFLNKIDLFKEKLQDVPITSAFPNYQGRQNYHECVNYMKEEIVGKNQNQQRIIYTHETCATNKDQIKHIIKNVIDVIVNSSLKAQGLIS